MPQLPAMARILACSSLVALAAAFGARTVELNLERSDAAIAFDQSRIGRATEIVPAWVDEILEALPPRL